MNSATYTTANVDSDLQAETHPVVEKALYLDAPVSSVWLAFADPERFGQWFGARLDRPFRVNEYTHGMGTFPGCEYLRWRAMTDVLDYERLLVFTWWPAPLDMPFDESAFPGTRVEIRLRATVDGTRVVIQEIGFDAIADPEEREALVRVRARGWQEQAANLRRYVDPA